jgi:hypothetical protein
LLCFVLPEGCVSPNALLFLLHQILRLTHALFSQSTHTHSTWLAVIEASCGWEMRWVHLLRRHSTRTAEALLLLLLLLL